MSEINSKANLEYDFDLGIIKEEIKLESDLDDIDSEFDDDILYNTEQKHKSNESSNNIRQTTSKKHFEQHLCTHTGEKPFACNLCEYTIITERNLKQHTNRMNTTTERRKRAANFSELEVKMLVDMLLEHIKVLENKQSDATSWKQKTATWETIATQFNNLTGNLNRTAKELRQKYDGLKRNIKKKKQSRNKFEIFKTEGGSPDTQDLTDYEAKLLPYIYQSVEGLPAQNDCDDILIIPDKQNTENLLPIAVTATSDSSMSSSNLAIAPSPTIEGTVEDKSEGISFGEYTLNECNVLEPVHEPKKARNEFTSDESCSTWSVAKLKTPKHKILNNKKVKKNTSDVSLLNNKIKVVADARKELILLQTETARNEEERLQKEHEKKIENLELQRQVIIKQEARNNAEFKLKEELLRLQIEHQKLLIYNI